MGALLGRIRPPAGTPVSEKRASMDKRASIDTVGSRRRSWTQRFRTFILPFPPLPVETVRYILEIAALHDPKTCHSLLHVSKCVNAWISPLLYHTVTLKTDKRRLRLFRRTIQGAGRSQNTPSAYVRRLLPRNSKGTERATAISMLVHRLFIVDYVVAHKKIIADIISNCVALEVLATDAYLEGLESRNSRWPSPSSVIFMGLRLTPIGHPFLRNVTHVWVWHLDDYAVRAVHSMPALTHMGTTIWAYENFDAGDRSYLARITHVLTTLPWLIVVIFPMDHVKISALEGGFWRGLAKIEEPRLLVSGRTIMKTHDEDIWNLWDDVDVGLYDWRDRVSS